MTAQRNPQPRELTPRQTIAAIRHRLEKWELEHLRQHCAELSERLERAEDEKERAWESAEFWRQSAEELQTTLLEGDHSIGLTKTGHIIAIPGRTEVAHG